MIQPIMKWRGKSLETIPEFVPVDYTALQDDHKKPLVSPKPTRPGSVNVKLLEKLAEG